MTRGRLRVALVTCADLPRLDPDDRLLLDPLATRGVCAEPAVWDDPGVDWAGCDLAVLRSPWDYPLRHREFLAWADRVPVLANPASIVAWNTDKRYLRELTDAGLPVVATEWVSPGERWRPPTVGEYVVKPAVSAGSIDTGRYDLTVPEHRRLLVEHLDRLAAADRLAMVQPYLPAVDTVGETALLFFGGPPGLRFSHAIRKGAMLTGPDRADCEELYRPERISPAEATPEQRTVAEQVLAAVPGGADRLLYARVDLIPGPDGTPTLVELELTEPSLFLGYAEGAAERFADAIVSHLTAR